jgi:DNA-directed RNA polymerase specialized sigma24 family protein
MGSEPADTELLGRLSADPAAFEIFYRRHVDRVIGFTARRVRDPADVADLVASTFLTVLTAARSYDESRGEPAAWLLGITARLIAGARRRRGREAAALPIRTVSTPAGDPASSPQAIRDDYTWLPDTAANRSQLTRAVAIPAGFRQVSPH